MDTLPGGLTATPTSELRATSSIAEPTFPCGICHKFFSRRDLRDRHRRRCIKTIGQERASRRKSCDHCVQKKLRCSMVRPSCDRCLQSGVQCHYPSSVRRPGNGEDNLSLSSTGPGSGAIMAAFHPLEDAGLIFATPGDGSLLWSDDLTALLEPSVLTPSDIASSVPIVPQDLCSVAVDANANFTTSDASLGETSVPSLPLTSPPSTNYTGDSHPGPSSLTSRLESPPNLILGHSFHPKLDRQNPQYADAICQDMLGLLRSYPRLTLDREYWSPFVHHRLYRCSLGGMAEPMGIALACVSAQAGAAGASHGFVDRMISQECEKLVRKFHGYVDTPETCLAALHAVCIYQILGLLGSIFAPAAVKPHPALEAEERQREDAGKIAELRSSFLLKMTRRLYNLHAQAIRTPHEEENDWDRWKFMESLRRNVFFVNMINILGAKARKLNEDYFEPLGDRLILEIPLPAPEMMWRACDEDEWLWAREQTLGSTTLHASGQSKPHTLGLLLRLSDQGQVDVASLLPITRMILASAFISPQGDSPFDLG